MEIGSHYNAISGPTLTAMVRTHGPEKAFNHLYDIYGDYMSKKMLVRLRDFSCCNPEVHNEDVKQEMWIDVITCLKNFYDGKTDREFEQPYNLILTIGYHRCSKHIKKCSAEPTIELETYIESSDDRISSEDEERTLLVTQKQRADKFFGVNEQKRLAELMAKKESQTLSTEEKQELENLVETELNAARQRAEELIGGLKA